LLKSENAGEVSRGDLMGRRRWSFEGEYKTKRIARMVATKRNKRVGIRNLNPYVVKGKKVFFDIQIKTDQEKWNKSRVI